MRVCLCVSCVHVGAWIRVWVLSVERECVFKSVFWVSLVGVHVGGHVDLGVGACLYKGEVWTHTCGGAWMPGA